jgi:hypothetical protein
MKEYQTVQNDLEKKLTDTLKKQKDEFLPGMDYINKWKYVVDQTETVPFVKTNYQGLPIK